MAVAGDRKIDYIELPARDLERAKQFYGEVFGWSFEDFGTEYTAFNDGRLDGGFFKSELCASTANGSALVVLYASELEATMQRVTEAGGAIAQEIFSFPGGRRFHFTDPNGNELAVWSDAGL
ncbi:MAG: VOC family protein [Cyanobacteria bacterium J06648_11]